MTMKESLAKKELLAGKEPIARKESHAWEELLVSVGLLWQIHEV